MTKIPNPVLVYHITAIDNLSLILSSGFLRSKNLLTNNNVGYADIAYQNIQGTRADKTVEVAPHGTLHDYVPFYFAPRSPMLKTLNSGNVPGCNYRQGDIVHLVTSVDLVVGAELPFVFYDYNATLGYSTPYNDLQQLKKIDWDLFFESPKLDGYCKYWFSKADMPGKEKRMETRMAEFLVNDELDINHIQLIGVVDDNKKVIVEDILASNDITIDVQVKTDWYFLGQ